MKQHKSVSNAAVLHVLVVVHLCVFSSRIVFAKSPLVFG